MFSDLFEYSSFNVHDWRTINYNWVVLAKNYENYKAGSKFEYVHLNLTNGEFTFCRETPPEFEGVHTRFK